MSPLFSPDRLSGFCIAAPVFTHRHGVIINPNPACRFPTLSFGHCLRRLQAPGQAFASLTHNPASLQSVGAAHANSSAITFTQYVMAVTAPPRWSWQIHQIGQVRARTRIGDGHENYSQTYMEGKSFNSGRSAGGPLGCCQLRKERLRASCSTSLGLSLECKNAMAGK
jgi:hypothetical protein